MPCSDVGPGPEYYLQEDKKKLEQALCCACKFLSFDEIKSLKIGYLDGSEWYSKHLEEDFNEWGIKESRRQEIDEEIQRLGLTVTNRQEKIIINVKIRG